VHPEFPAEFDEELVSGEGHRVLFGRNDASGKTTGSKAGLVVVRPIEY
jgi:hypothetical protein